MSSFYLFLPVQIPLPLLWRYIIRAIDFDKLLINAHGTIDAFPFSILILP